MTKRSREKKKRQRRMVAFCPLGRRLGDRFFQQLRLEIDLDENNLSWEEFTQLTSDSKRKLWWNNRDKSLVQQTVRSRVDDIYGLRAIMADCIYRWK